MSETQEKLQQEQEGSVQQKEQKTLERAGVKFENNVYKIDLRENAVQEQSADEVPVRDEPETSQEVGQEVRSPEEPSQEEKVIELINDQEDELRLQKNEGNEKQTLQTEEPVRQEEEKVILPENIQKVVEFMDETGGSLEDYVRLNADYSKIDELTLLKEYYKQTKSHLDNEEIDFLLEDNFSYDEELDERSDYKIV